VRDALIKNYTLYLLKKKLRLYGTVKMVYFTLSIFLFYPVVHPIYYPAKPATFLLKATSDIGNK
jgi:hypothetical protein